jgi:site-specific DNA-methyltransferase (adenine-specific)
VPKQSKDTRPPKKEKPLYRQKPNVANVAAVCDRRTNDDLPHAKAISATHFQLREDGSIAPSDSHPRPSDGRGAGGEGSTPQLPTPKLIYSSDAPFVRLYHGNCLELLDAIAAKYPEGRFDAIFADPPYFLSNGGITCHAGKMVKVDKGDWDKSRGPELNHEFNKEWLARCQRVLKPNGTIWVSGTHHVIFSIGYAMQELGYKILNDIAWEKPNPPPNLSCRYFTHSTEIILWAAKNEKSKHTFNYQDMRKVTGKQMKTVWTMSAPKNSEKAFGKHPTQKPVALVERCILASTNSGDFVLDPFLGSGTTAVAAVRLNRHFIGIELNIAHLSLARTRADREIIEIWLNYFRVRVEISITGRAALPRGPNFSPSTPDPDPLQFPLDLFSNPINGSPVDDKPQVPTERIFHETKFVFLSCAEVAHGSVVHTTVDISLQEAWAKTPTGKKRETTHIVRCETEILKLKSH